MPAFNALLQHPNIDVNIQSNYSKIRPLDCAFYANSDEMSRMLINHNKIDLDVLNKDSKDRLQNREQGDYMGNQGMPKSSSLVSTFTSVASEAVSVLNLFNWHSGANKEANSNTDNNTVIPIDIHLSGELPEEQEGGTE